MSAFAAEVAIDLGNLKRKSEVIAVLDDIARERYGMIKTKSLIWRIGRLGGFADHVASKIDFSGLTDVSVGCFRISKEYLSSMRKKCLDSEIAWYPYVIRNGVAQYEEDTDRKMQEFMCAELSRHIAEEKIFTWN